MTNRRTVALDEGAGLHITTYDNGSVMLTTRSPGYVIVTTVHLTGDQVAALRAALSEEGGDE